MQMAVRAHNLVKPFFRDVETRHVATQLLRAASSVAANYRAACLGRSGREFVAKIGTVREEADETVFWLSFMERVAMVPPGVSCETAALKDEAEQLARIFAASYRTAQRKLIEQRRARRAAKHQSTSGNPPSP
jgi:four helix bundle protein